MARRRMIRLPQIVAIIDPVAEAAAYGVVCGSIRNNLSTRIRSLERTEGCAEVTS